MIPLPLDGTRPLLVAELSANHGGNLERAVATIHAAADSGADAIKIQTYTADSMTLDCDGPEFLIAHGPWAGRRLFELYEEAHTPWAWHGALMKAAHQRGLPLFSTPFDTAAVDLLETLPVPAYKIASFEITDLRLCQKIAATGRPILLSTGMATLAEIDQAVAAIQHVWTSQQIQSELVLLKCVSAYPAPANDMNLRTIPHLSQAFGVKVGLSDHTLGTAVAVAAVALGAQVIEKHFTLRRSDGGPDSAFSAEPAELRCLADALREAHAALGQVRYGATSSDRANRLFRRSLFFSADVKAGSVITLDNVRVVRPGHGLSPHFLPLVLGRRLTCNCPRGTPVAWSHVGEGVGGAAQMASSTAADGDGMIG